MSSAKWYVRSMNQVSEDQLLMPQVGNETGAKHEPFLHQRYTIHTINSERARSMLQRNQLICRHF